MVKKSISLIIIAPIVLSGLLILPPKTEAASSISSVLSGCGLSQLISNEIAGVLGSTVAKALTGAVPTNDAKAQAIASKFKIETCVRAGLKALEETALTILKRRVLNVMVDQIINWIKGGGSPQFWTDPGSFFKSASQAAVGDVVQNIGLSDLCKPLRVPLLEFVAGGPGAVPGGGPPFSQQITCTLDQVVSNIDNFYNDFRAGGWVAYREAWRPQNNYYGALLLAGDEIATQEANQLQAAQSELLAGQGYKSTKECLEWTLYATQPATPSDTATHLQILETITDDRYKDPSHPPDINEGAVPEGYTNPYWQCSKPSISLPGQTVAGVTQKALTAQIDNVINAQTFEDYADALVSAAINRVIQIGVAGIKGTPTPNAPHLGYVELSQRGTLPTNDAAYGELNTAATNYTAAQNETQNSSTRTDTTAQLAYAQTFLTQTKENLINASSTNADVINDLNTFIGWCGRNGDGASHPLSCGPRVGQLTSATALVTEINQNYAALGPLQDKLDLLQTQLNSATAGDLPDITAAISDLVNQINPLADYAQPLPQSLSTQKQNLESNYQNCLTPTSPSTCN